MKKKHSSRSRQLVLALDVRAAESGLRESEMDFTSCRGPGKLLRRLIETRRLPSILLFGPPGTGKTTLAHLLARETHGKFRQINAVTSGIKELRESLARAHDEVSATGVRP